VSDWSYEETDNPLVADHRNFYKVEKWTKDGQRVERMLFADNSLDRARRFSRPSAAPAARSQHDPLAYARARRMAAGKRSREMLSCRKFQFRVMCMVRG
jgi:hypothetical protein